MGSSAAFGTAFAMSLRFPVPVGFPFPFCVPGCTPDRPGGVRLYRLCGKRGCGKTGVSIRSKRIRWNIFFQGNNSCQERSLCSTGTIYRYTDLYCARIFWSMPFDPDKLRSILWHGDIGYGISAAINVKGCFCRIFRVYFGGTG